MAEEFDNLTAPMRASYRAVCMEFLDELVRSVNDGQAMLSWQGLVRSWERLEPYQRAELKAEARALSANVRR